MLQRMRYFTSFFTILVFVFCGASSAFAETFERGILWKIEREGYATSYLLGTAHVSDERVVSLTPEIQQAFDQSDIFVSEITMNIGVAGELLRYAFLPNNETLAMHLTDEQLQDLDRLIRQERPDLLASYLRMQPVFLAISLSVPVEENPLALVLDAKLQYLAVKQKKQIRALESPTEQIEALFSLSFDQEVQMLVDTVSEFDTIEPLLNELLDRYVARDLKGVASLSREYAGDDPVLKAFMKTLIDDRNLRMLQRLKPLLNQGKVFAAVGAAHLPGELGLLNLLQQQGYDIQVVNDWQTP